MVNWENMTRTSLLLLARMLDFTVPHNISKAALQYIFRSTMQCREKVHDTCCVPAVYFETLCQAYCLKHQSELRKTPETASIDLNDLSRCNTAERMAILHFLSEKHRRVANNNVTTAFEIGRQWLQWTSISHETIAALREKTETDPKLFETLRKIDLRAMYANVYPLSFGGDDSVCQYRARWHEHSNEKPRRKKRQRRQSTTQPSPKTAKKPPRAKKTKKPQQFQRVERSSSVLFTGKLAQQFKYTHRKDQVSDSRVKRFERTWLKSLARRLRCTRCRNHFNKCPHDVGTIVALLKKCHRLLRKDGVHCQPENNAGDIDANYADILCDDSHV